MTTIDFFISLIQVQNRKKFKLTRIDVGKEDEGPLVEGEQGIQHQSIDLNGVLDVCCDRMLQSHNIITLLHLFTCTMNTKAHTSLQLHRNVSHYIFVHVCIPSQLLIISM